MNSQFHHTRAIVLQALAYVTALICTILPRIIAMATGKSSIAIGRLHLALFPVQGVLNFLIFVGAKVYHIRCRDPTLSFPKVLRRILTSREYEDSAEAVLLLGISIISTEGDSNAQLEVWQDQAEIDDAAEEQITEGSGWPEGVSWHSRSATATASLKSSGVSEYDKKSLSIFSEELQKE